MKNYIDSLTKEELRYICERIGGKNLRDDYKRNTKTFNKYKPGFRPGNLSDDETYNFACANKKLPFVANLLNSHIDEWLKEISEAKASAIKDGQPENIALIETLAMSFFSEKPELYLKISEAKVLIDNEDVFYYAIKVACENNRRSSAATSIDIAEERISQLKYMHESEIQTQKEEYEQELKKEGKKIESLNNTIEQYKERLEKIESERTELGKELESYRELSGYTEDEEEIKPKQGYDYISLCITYIDDFRRDRLLRVADIRDGGISDIFVEYSPEYTRLYRYDGPSKDGSLGVWDWRVVPNKSDPTKDYIETSFNNSIKPIEVIVPEECNTINELLEKLKKGFPFELHTERVLISVFDNKKYEGIYCDLKELEDKVGWVKLKANVLKLPVYNFYKVDVLAYETITILNKINLGLPAQLIRVKNPLEIVQECLIKKATWPVTQQNGFVRNEYQQIKTFLKDLQTTDLYEDISISCECSLDEAKQYLEDFMNRADNVVIGKTIENDAMVQIIRNDTVAYSSCIEDIKKEWEKENKLLLSEARDSLCKIKKEEADYRELCRKKNEELNLLQKKIYEAAQKMDEQKQLADEVEKLVLQKIAHARSNAAEFIAENAFIQVNGQISAVHKTEQTNDSEKETPLFIEHSVIDDKDQDINEDYEQLLHTVQMGLSEAGVSSEFTFSLAALLYGAYLKRIPILLAGPNGHEIADAFTAALDCRTAAVVKCMGIDNTALMTCKESTEDVVVIENPLQASWENNVIRLISMRERFYILTQPFAEDLVIEPRGLFNYCLPVITDLFVSTIPTKKYIGGKRSADFKDYNLHENTKTYDKILDKLKVTALIRENIKNLSSNINKLLKTDEPDYVLQLLLYPLAYALGETRTLVENIDKLNRKPSEKVIEKLRILIGEDE